MNKYDVMYKCPICDQLISKLIYTTFRYSGVCSRCETPIIYSELFKIDKSDKIKTSINIESDIEVIIKNIIEEILGEEFEKTYRDGYSRGFEEGEDKGYSEGYSEGVYNRYGTRS